MVKFLVFLFVLQFVSSHGFELQPRIINGIQSNSADYPFYVYIGRNDATFGGTLLSDRYNYY